MQRPYESWSETTLVVPIAQLSLPAWDSCDGTVRVLASRLWQVFAKAPADVMDSVVAWLREQPIRHGDPGRLRGCELRHELSGYLAPASTEAFTDGRSLAECHVLKQAGLPSAKAVADGNFSLFCETLKGFHHAMGLTDTGFRSRPVYTQRDRAGVCTVYPGQELIYPQLERIYVHWKRYFHMSRGFAAVVAMVALLNVHVFNDGNGRVARLFFHWTLNEGRGSPLYLPIYELSALSQCGYLIRLRQASYHSDWRPLFAYFLMCSERLFTNLVPERSGWSDRGGSLGLFQSDR